MQNVDIIFCRNVIIYFDFQATQRVLENFYNCLAQDGYLFLGHTETLWQITNRFERVEFPQTFIYKKRLGPIQEDATKPFMAVPEIEIENLTLSARPILNLWGRRVDLRRGDGHGTTPFPAGMGMRAAGETRAL